MKKKLALLSMFIVVSFSVCGCCIVAKRSTVGPCEVITESKQLKKNIRQLYRIDSPRKELLVGETYSYKVWWLGMDVADAQLVIKERLPINGRDAYHVVLTAETNKFFSFFCYAKSKVESFVDAATFKPIKYESDSFIKKKKVFKKMEYDFKSKLVFAEDKKGKYELSIPDDVLDPLGIFYYFTLNQVKLDEPIRLNINAGKKNYALTLYVEREKKISVPAGKFWAFLVQPSVQSEEQFVDVLNATGKMWVWFSCDERRIPVIMILKLPFATAQAILTGIDSPVAKPVEPVPAQNVLLDGEKTQERILLEPDPVQENKLQNAELVPNMPGQENTSQDSGRAESVPEKDNRLLLKD